VHQQSSGSNLSTSSEDVDRIRAEIQKNREQILQLQRRNAQLSQNLRSIDISTRPDLNTAARPGGRRVQKRRKSKIFRYPKRMWVSLSIAATIIAIFSGLLGFVAVKILTSR
jgi:uncharacterized membrane protein YccC